MGVKMTPRSSSSLKKSAAPPSQSGRHPLSRSGRAPGSGRDALPRDPGMHVEGTCKAGKGLQLQKRKNALAEGAKKKRRDMRRRIARERVQERVPTTAAEHVSTAS